MLCMTSLGAAIQIIVFVRWWCVSLTSKSMTVMALLCRVIPALFFYWFSPQMRNETKVSMKSPWLMQRTVFPRRASLFAISLNILMTSFIRTINSGFVSLWSIWNQPSSVRIYPYSSLIWISGKNSITCGRVSPGKHCPFIYIPPSSWIWVIISQCVVSEWT